MIAKTREAYRTYRISPGDTNRLVLVFDPIGEQANFVFAIEIFDVGRSHRRSRLRPNRVGNGLAAGPRTRRCDDHLTREGGLVSRNLSVHHPPDEAYIDGELNRGSGGLGRPPDLS